MVSQKQTLRRLCSCYLLCILRDPSHEASQSKTEPGHGFWSWGFELLGWGFEPVVRHQLARLLRKREEASKAGKPVTLAPAPYVALRDERPFTFDPCTYPLHSVLAEALGVGSLADVHKYQCRSKQELLSPLLDRGKRLRFHELYDVFVTSFCIPMLHSLALKMKILNTTSDAIYRYQEFPCLRVVRPGEFSIGPHCDTAYGHSIGNLNFHVPLTPVLRAEGAK